jgi:hypothetical protein
MYSWKQSNNLLHTLVQGVEDSLISNILLASSKVIDTRLNRFCFKVFQNDIFILEMIPCLPFLLFGFAYKIDVNSTIVGWDSFSIRTS